MSFDATTIPLKIDKIFGPTDPIYFLGWASFKYGGYCGQQVLIRYAHQIFFPENDAADGFTVICKPGVIFDLLVKYRTLDPLNIQVLGEAVNLALGNVSGLKRIGNAGLEGSAPVLIGGAP